MKTIYVLRSMYLPNSAVTNRLFGHLRAFSMEQHPLVMVTSMSGMILL